MDLFGLFDFIEKLIGKVLENPKVFAYFLTLSLFVVVICFFRIRAYYSKKLTKYANTVIAQYEIEKEYLKYIDDDGFVNKSKIRAIAYSSCGFKTEIYRSQAIKYSGKKEDFE